MKIRNALIVFCATLIVILCINNNLSQARVPQPQTLPHPHLDRPHFMSVPNQSTLDCAERTCDRNWQGQQIYLNQQKLSIPWIQWQEESWHTAIADIAAMQILGLELLDTDNLEFQPVLWFSKSPTQPIQLPVKRVGFYRYLDVTELIQLAGWQLQTTGDTLIVNAPVAKIDRISRQQEKWGEQIIVNLDRPTFWQTVQDNKQGTITLEAIASASAFEGFDRQQSSFLPSPSRLRSETVEYSESTEQSNFPKQNIHQDKIYSGIDLNSTDENPEEGIDNFLPPLQPQLSPSRVENLGFATKLSFDFDKGQRLKISTQINPYRLAIELRKDSFAERNILWHPGLRWHQQYIQIAPPATTLSPLFPEDADRQNQFPVTWLEIDPRSSHISLKPIVSDPNSMVGTAPLLTTASSTGAIAAINAGFFNRNNRLPLGAIRRANFWYSSPILNRAAIAWNDSGDVKIDRLSWRETISTSTGKNLPVHFLNSGYVQAGISRYTKEWGQSYTPLTNSETIVLVKNNRVSEQLLGEMARKNSFPIPSDGYLLTIRGNEIPAEIFEIGMTVSLNSNTIPSDFDRYPNIIGAGPLLIQKRQIVLDAIAEKFSAAFNRQLASRSAIGINGSGQLVLAVVRSRIGGSGPNLSELAQIMQSLGAIDAINLDGGSSTSLYLGGQLLDRSASDVARVHNGIGVFFKRRSS